MSLPLAYFLTWRTYGTWLHGDARGSVDRRHNVPHSFYLPPNPKLEAYRRKQLRTAPVTLSQEARLIVKGVVRTHCEIRCWDLLAVNARTNHVHVVVNCAGMIDPDGVTAQFKAWSTRRLREGGLFGRDAHVWADHGSTRWLDTPESLAEAIDYVLNGQD